MYCLFKHTHFHIFISLYHYIEYMSAPVVYLYVFQLGWKKI